MRSIKVMGCAVVAALALASSASAANWDPVNTPVTGHGVLTLTSGSASVTCTTHITVTSTGNAVASGTPSFTNCTDSIIHSPSTAVDVTAPWVATATSTTSVDVTGNGTITIGGVCTITAEASVPNNVWSNTNHTLAANSASAFNITRHGLCAGTASTATMSGELIFASSAIIT